MFFNFQNNIKGSEQQPKKPPNAGTLLKAVQSYSPAFFDELNVRAGDKITFLDQIEPGWWRGKSNSRVGDTKNINLKTLQADITGRERCSGIEVVYKQMGSENLTAE